MMRLVVIALPAPWMRAAHSYDDAIVARPARALSEVGMLRGRHGCRSTGVPSS